MAKQGSAGLCRLAASLGWQHSSSQQQGCTSTCRATAGITLDMLKTRNFSKAGILCLELAFKIFLDTDPYNSWRDG